MAPWTAAVVCWCALCCLVFLTNSIFCCDTQSSFTRGELMNIRETASDIIPSFLCSAVELLNILVKGTLAFPHAVKRWRRGRCAAVRAPDFTTRGYFSSSTRSLCNKLDKLLLLLVGENRDFSSSSVLCFMETWKAGSIPDSGLQLASFQLFRVDPYTELFGKAKGGESVFISAVAGATM